MVLPRNPSSSVVATDESQNYPDGAQLHNLYPAPGPLSVAAHQMPLGSLYNPPSFPIHGARFPLPYASTFQAHLQNVPSQAAPPYRPFSSFQPSAAAGTWHSGLSPHSYYLVALPKNVKKCYGCGDMFAEKFRQPPHNTVAVVKHVRGSPPRHGKGPGNEVGSLVVGTYLFPPRPPFPSTLFPHFPATSR